MPRKPHAIVQYKLRIRESLRRRIEVEAKRRGVSANQEMVRRLEKSFAQQTKRDLDSIAKDWAFYTAELRVVLRAIHRGEEIRGPSRAELEEETRAALAAMVNHMKDRIGDDK